MVSSEKSKLDSRDLLLQEFQEAWNHYRHLENERSWSLGFLFTITMASVGWTAKILSESTPKESVNAHFSCMLVMIAVCALAITIYARVSKTYFALRHYVKAWHFIRMKFYGKAYEELNSELDVDYDKSIQAYFTGDTVTTNWMIWAVIIFSFTYLIFGVCGFWPHFHLNRDHRGVIAILTFLLLLFFLFVLFSIRRAEAMKDPYDIEHE